MSLCSSSYGVSSWNSHGLEIAAGGGSGRRRFLFWLFGPISAVSWGPATDQGYAGRYVGPSVRVQPRGRAHAASHVSFSLIIPEYQHSKTKHRRQPRCRGTGSVIAAQPISWWLRPDLYLSLSLLTFCHVCLSCTLSSPPGLNVRFATSPARVPTGTGRSGHGQS